MMLRSAFLLAALALSAPVRADVVSKVERARALMNQGNAHELAGKFNDAFDSYRAAAKADPSASEPVSYLALLMVHASNHTEEKYVATYRTQAATYATAALKIDARDSNAIKAHRLLGASMEAAHHTPAPAALAAIGDGNALLETGQYAQAALKYEAAIRIDPAYGAAWRSLYDALAAQEKFSDAQAAALGALATMPSVKPNWHRVAESMERAGRPLSTFLWRARAGVTPQGIEIDPGAPESDSAAWMAYALSLAVEESGPPFARELAAWNSTLQIIGEMGSTAKIHDPGLRDMIRFNAGGQLKAALFALHYNEAWRAEFEAWKKAEPDGLRRFVETFRTGL